MINFISNKQKDLFYLKMISCFSNALNSQIFNIICVRFSSTTKYFVTTPIYYVNGEPHIGHLQSCLYADAIARARTLLGDQVLFSTGTDEHGLKVQQAAESSKKPALLYCNEVSSKFKDVFKKANISYTHFIRTTDKKHKENVQNFWRKLDANGYIKKGYYDGWYSVREEAFVPSSQIKEIKEGSTIKMVSIETGSPVEKMQEENYIFPLYKFKNDLLHWLSKDVVKPSLFVDELKRTINEGLYDLSISRPQSRITWGIPVPDNDTQIIYVWLDALISYLTAGNLSQNNNYWPPDCHIIGKEILKFHAIYWPAFLMAAGYEPPRQIFVHSHWTVNYEKMSKSRGNVVDPLTLMEKYTCEGFRYFLLRASVPHSDTNYSEIKIQRMLNAELADTLGNLLNRCCATSLNPKQIFPSFSHKAFESICDENVKGLIGQACSLPETVQNHFLDGYFFNGLEILMECLRTTNAFLQFQLPWKLVKLEDIQSQEKLATILHIALEVLRISGILLQPIMPHLSSKLLTRLGIKESERMWTNLVCFPSYRNLNNTLEGRTLGKNTTPFFERLKI